MEGFAWTSYPSSITDQLYRLIPLFQACEVSKQDLSAVEEDDWNAIIRGDWNLDSQRRTHAVRIHALNQAAYDAAVERLRASLPPEDPGDWIHNAVQDLFYSRLQAGLGCSSILHLLATLPLFTGALLVESSLAAWLLSLVGLAAGGRGLWRATAWHFARRLAKDRSVR